MDAPVLSHEKEEQPDANSHSISESGASALAHSAKLLSMEKKLRKKNMYRIRAERDREMFFDRKGLPPKLRNYILPMAMRTPICSVTDVDEGNSALERIVRSSVHYDMNTALGMPFSNAFLLVLPTGVKIDKNAPDVPTLPSFVVNEIAKKTGVKRLGEGGKARLWEKSEAYLNAIYSQYINMTCMAHYDPRMSAATALVMCHQYSYFEDSADDMRAGAFIANTILLAEGMVPLTAEIIRSAVLMDAVLTDVNDWARVGDVVVTRTFAVLKALRWRCDVCGAFPKGIIKRVKNAAFAGDDFEAPNAHTCSRCERARYCGPTCQKEDWERHRAFCADNAK